MIAAIQKVGQAFEVRGSENADRFAVYTSHFDDSD
jgi:hypothetical protein